MMGPYGNFCKQSGLFKPRLLDFASIKVLNLTHSPQDTP
jgi:hypothetical protein